MLNTLWFKVTAAFLLVAILVVGLVAVLANQATNASFQRFLSQERAAEAATITDDLGAYYTQQGDWQGVEALLQAYQPGRGMGGGGRVLVLLDESGREVASSGGGRGRRLLLNPDDGYPIVIDGQQVGTLLVDEAGMMGGRAAEQFLDSVNRSLMWAAGAAVALALLLGALLARGLTRPLRQLTQATRDLSAGDLEQEVTVNSKDELGELATSFNHMAAALTKNEQQRQQLFADIAHELRTPISVMHGQLESMLDGVFQTTPENLTVVYEETILLEQLVEDLRTLSLAESGQLPLAHEPLDLGQAVAQTLAAFEPLAEADGVRLRMETDSDLPQVAADPARIQQLLGNLLSNALRHANQRNGQTPDVFVQVTAVSGKVRVSVADNGPGLSAEAQEHIFDRFWRADSARSRDRGGTGLGLAICQGIVDAHGGQIWVTSTSGEGATFTFELSAL